jgi:hypothetical protein
MSRGEIPPPAALLRARRPPPQAGEVRTAITPECSSSTDAASSDPFGQRALLRRLMARPDDIAGRVAETLYRKSQNCFTAPATAALIMSWRSGEFIASSSSRLMIEPASSKTAGILVRSSTTR